MGDDDLHAQLDEVRQRVDEEDVSNAIEVAREKLADESRTGVKILDTNLWVFGMLGASERSAQLLDEIEHGEMVSAITAYMVQEAFNAFDRTPGLTASERDEVKTLPSHSTDQAPQAIFK